MLAGVAHGRNGIGALTTSEKKTAMWQTVEVDDTVCVLLDDFETVAAAGAATKLGRGGEGGMREDEHCGRGWFHSTCAVEQAASVVADGGLLNAGKQDKR